MAVEPVQVVVDDGEVVIQKRDDGLFELRVAVSEHDYVSHVLAAEEVRAMGDLAVPDEPVFDAFEAWAADPPKVTRSAPTTRFDPEAGVDRCQECREFVSEPHLFDCAAVVFDPQVQKFVEKHRL